MRRRADQRHPRRRMTQLRDELGDLEARQLTAFAGLGALRDLDLDLVACAEIFGGDAEAARRDLLDRRIGIVAILIGLVADRILAALARHRLGADAVHRDRQRLVRLGAERAQRHARCDEALADLGDRLDLVDPDAFGREIELEQVPEVDRRQIAHPARELQIGRIAIGRGQIRDSQHLATRLQYFQELARE